VRLAGRDWKTAKERAMKRGGLGSTDNVHGVENHRWDEAWDSLKVIWNIEQV